jgi:hypothetical protein
MGQAKIIYVFYRHARETNEFLRSNGSVNRRNYFRTLALACIDILLTLPLGVILTTISVLDTIRDLPPGYAFEFYYGWALVHSDWAPAAFSYSTPGAAGRFDVVEFYLENWSSPILAIAIFSFFGLTSEARSTYWRGFCTVGRLFGWKSPAPKDTDLGEIVFGARQLTTTERCVSRLFAP